MSSVLCPEAPLPGFSFENHQRNAFLAKKGFPAPKAIKTGTTIVGLVYRDGVVLGADTRATSDNIVATKNASKIHYMASNMYCGGAGTAADLDFTTKSISSQLELHRLNTGRIVPVITANMMLRQLLYRYQGHIGAALILGGVDNSGPHLYQIYPHGSSDSLPFCSMGSGSLAAMSILESRWKPDLLEEEAKLLVRDAIASGIFFDLASGNNVDMCVIRKGSVDYLRPYEIANEKGKRFNSYKYQKGTTIVLSQRAIPIVVEEEVVRKVPAPDAEESMDTS